MLNKKQQQVEERGINSVGAEKTEVATADFTWVLYVPGGEVGFTSPPPSEKGTRGEGGGERDKGRGGGERRMGEEEEEPCSTAAFINMRTCSLRRYGEANRCPFLHINTHGLMCTTAHCRTCANSNTNTFFFF